MIKVSMEWFNTKDPAKKDIAQIYSNGLEFAVATKSKQCSHFVFCKDFLHDVVWANLYNKRIDLYRFFYDPVAHPIDVFDLTRVLVANSSDQYFNQKIPNCLDFINQIEKDLRLKRTVAYECENPPEDYILSGGVFLLEGSQRWMNSPPLLSMYTLLLRCGFVHKIGDHYNTTLDKIENGDLAAYQDNDKDFLQSSRPGIKAIMALGYRKIFFKDMTRNYLQNINVNDLHHRCGIRAFSWGETKETVPHWHRNKLLSVLKGKSIEIPDLWTIPQPPSLPENTLINTNVKTTLKKNENLQSGLLVGDISYWR
jgi:hypothetical protein